MRSLLALALSTLLLSGCVTENSYNGSNKPVPENKLNNNGAARTRIALALQYLKTGNNSQAKYNLERAAEYAPNLPEVHYSLAYYYQQVGENALADKAYQKALAIKPDDPNTLNNYGTFLCSIDEYDRATEQFLKAIEVPSYIRVAQSYENLALCAIESNDFTSAESYFQQALNHSSQRASTLISLAALYYAKSDLYKASNLLKRYEDSAQVSSRALLLNYLIKQRMGAIEEAEKIAATILQTYPNSVQANAILNNQIKQTEFEVLSEKYRQAQLNELQRNSSKNNQAIIKPKIKIVRKKNTINEVSTDSSIDNNTDFKTIYFGEPQSNLIEPNTQEKTTYKSVKTKNQVVFNEPDIASKEITNKRQEPEDTRKKSNQLQHKLLNPILEDITIPFHIIRPGENLFSISLQYNVKLKKLLQWNNLKESDRIVGGQKIYLNNPNIFYEIKADDTLNNIATQNKILIDQLIRWNKLSPDIALKPGHKLLIVDPDSYLL
ncbi:type IV pilus biogenesis/stability protein PilW [Pseudoalteromonas sp.]|uniref:type IV pilus biogenesis/stability protein PilW n=1 Tax=Pseudoalteromonas sp. TaxID=53249 RepID=UPI001BCA77D8|nr:type IV pilus biogenesis/stability protein PilW [Pseudoalteromonas sp.]